MAVKIIQVFYNFIIAILSVGPYFLALQPAEPGQARIIILYLLNVFIQRYAIQIKSDKIITAWVNKVRTTASSDKIREGSMIKIRSKLSLSLRCFWLKLYFSYLNFGWKNSTIVACDVNKTTLKMWLFLRLISCIHSFALSAVLNYE